MSTSYVDDLSELIRWPRELRNLEFKKSMSWGDPATKAKVVKSVLAMANLRDGGHIVFGIERKANDDYLLVGMEVAHADSFVQDDLSAYLSEYADPYIEVELVKHIIDGKTFCILRVDEFAELPVVCKRDGAGGLRRGAVYVRSRRMVETVEVPSQVEMREILDLAIEKRSRAFANQAHRMGLVNPPSTDEFLEQLKMLPATEVLKKLRSSGHWRFSIRPTTFERARFQSTETCRNFILNNEVRTTDGWQFPMVRNDRIVDDREYITSERDLTGNVPFPLPHMELWTLFRSGQFVYNLAFAEDLWPGDPHRFIAVQGKRYLHVRLTLKIVSCLFEFAARMAARDVLAPQAAISIELHNVDGRELTYMDPERRLDETYFSRKGTITIERLLDPSELRSNARQLALNATVEILNRFGWPNPPKSLLAEDQARFLT
jgi:hypothetical protein